MCLEPDRAGAHLSLGWAFRKKGVSRKHGKQFDTAIRLQPDYAAAYLNRGGLQEENG